MRLLWKTNLALAVWLICGETAKIQLKYEYCATPQGAADEVCIVSGLKTLSPVAAGDRPVAQLVEHCAGNSEVAGSNPRQVLPRQSIPQLLRDAAARHGVDPERVLRLAWKESRFDPHPPSSCCFGVMQLHPRYFPGAARMSVEQNIEAGVAFLARLIREHGAEAEVWFRFGHGRGKGN